ncbi:iron ABC transporter permease [Hoyosella rhizosphaerae]|uniref:RDD domain-containing protein n=1 Tax=Hoyosella rhizosphaerae TaxID=1755582 RepID=A0A916TZD9_9ACTN|nr:iron ABC transporter permease [Hoyosella rhizosphaerae]MBN4927280.1 iron ABC transporter permease [Hoyosella rhizosphaerae]GGC52503.1 hypothetical protein GCM10011410_01060 [Hoyosella rhizosphaerae]
MSTRPLEADTLPSAARADPPPQWERLTSHLIDVAATCAPLLIGALIVTSLREEAGGGQADRVAFTAFTLLATIATALWNFGHLEGRTGSSIGKHAMNHTLRNTTTKQAVGRKPNLYRRATFGLAGPSAEVVTTTQATADGFITYRRNLSITALRRQRLAGITVLTAILAMLILASLAIGARPLSLAEVGNALIHPTGIDTDIIVRTLRFPRTLLAITVGVAIGVAGALIQGHTRNPLADPGILGVIPGAAFAVVLAVYLFRLSSPIEYIWFAFAGAFLTTVAVFTLASIGRGGASPLTLPLAGVAVGAFLAAMTNAIVLLDQASLDAYRFWNVGSVAGRGFDVLVQVLPFIIVGLILAFASTPGLNLLSLGDDVARSLGTSIVRTRIIGVLAITLLAGAATAACGVIAFLGLVVPHIARAITGPDYRWLIPVAALCGAILLLTADVVGRVVIRPGELQLSIVLALVGGPFFIALVRRRKLVSL